MEAFFDFEKPIVTLEKKLQDLRELSRQEGVNLDEEINALEKKVGQLIDETYKKLTPWQRVQLSRHPTRPYTRDYLEALFPDFMELHGDRGFSDDRAIMGGVAQWPPVRPGQPPAKSTGQSIMIIGHQKGRTTKQKMLRNFGMAKPEGYRKAIRLMKLADRMRIPILTLIDTPGAYPGLETEERGQAQAIAESIRIMFDLSVPVVSVVIGEGGSGGALAVGIADKVLMMEYATYSVISPEGCASILWSDVRMAEKASGSLKMTPPDLNRVGVIDGIIKEPKGGAHRDWKATFELFRKQLIEQVTPMIKGNWLGQYYKKKPAATGGGKKKSNTKKIDHFKFRNARLDKFRKMGLDALGSVKK